MNDQITLIHFAQWNRYFPKLVCNETRSIHMGEGIWALQSDYNPEVKWRNLVEKE